MNPIRVHLGPMPLMLRDMINHLLTAEPDMEIVGNSYSGEDPLPVASAQRAEILIAQERASGDGGCTAAVISGEPTAILAVADDGHDGTSVSLVRRPVSLNGAGSSLAEVVRDLLRSASSAKPRHQDSLEG